MIEISFDRLFDMGINRLASLSQALRERMAYIDFRLYFFGEIGRPDLIERFGVAPAGATRDLALYREIAPQNITFDGSNKIYHIGQAFSPLFGHASQRVLQTAPGRRLRCRH